MVGREDITLKRERNDAKYEKFLIVLYRLEDGELAVVKQESVLSDVVSVYQMKSKDISLENGDEEDKRSKRSLVSGSC